MATKVKFDPKIIGADFAAGLTTALVTIPDGLASAILAGLNPVHGLYALMVGMPVAALTMSSQFMYVANTGALAVATGDALSGYGPDELAGALVVLVIIVGLVQVALGLLKLGGITRYVSNAVMVGFMTGIAVSIILGQLSDFTGYESEFGNRVLAAFDLIFNLDQIQLASLAIGALTILLIILFKHTRLAKFSMVLALVLAAIVANMPLYPHVELIGDITDISSGFPRPVLPDLSLVPGLIGSGVALALIGLIQAAGVSKSVPNADGNYPDTSRDFAGQGLGNIASGFFQGMPLGGTMSETSVNLSAGARSRLANVISALLIIAFVALLAGLIERIPLPAVSGLLIVAGYEAIKIDNIEDVRDTGPGPRWTMIITFIATLFMPIQYAVLTGVILSVVIYLYGSSTDVRVVERVRLADGTFEERPAPEALSSTSVTLLHVYGSLYFAGASVFEEKLPAPQRAERAVVVLHLRGLDSAGSTFIGVVERYSQRLQDGGGKLILAGVHDRLLQQLELTETTEVISPDDIYQAESRLGRSTANALAAAYEWLHPVEATDEPAGGENVKHS